MISMWNDYFSCLLVCLCSPACMNAGACGELSTERWDEAKAELGDRADGRLQACDPGRADVWYACLRPV
jgi:hypothetical protein